MRSGWPHTQADHGRLPADERRGPFGPDISWPTGYSDLEYREGDYRYSPPAAQPPAAQGQHPYAAFSAAGYGDDGYSDPGYDGPAAQDAGYRQASYPPATRSGNGYGHSGYAPSGYSDSREIELAYPAPAHPGQQGQGYGAPESYEADSYRGAAWDYDQPLRYDGEDTAYPARESYGQQHDEYRNADGYGPGVYEPAPVYDPADYNGSSYSRPGIDGPGYDLSGIIGTGDFEAFGYDEPAYDERRLSYDDPRYDDNPRGGGRYDYDDGPRGGGSAYDAPRGGDSLSDDTRLDLAGFGGSGYNGPRFDETRLDNLWLSDEDIRGDAPVGYENDGFSGDSRVGPRYPDFGAPDSGRFDETRLDLGADMRMDQTRFDVPAYDETRIDNMRALNAPSAAIGLLAPPDERQLGWAQETSFDDFGDLYEEPAPAPAAFTRTIEREDDTATRRAIGRRRGRSGDRRQWMALGAIAVVAAGTIGGVLMKYVFSGPSGPAHTVVAPNQADGFTRQPNLEKQLKVDSLAETFMKDSSGHMSHLVPAVYEQGSAVSGASPQIFEFVGGQLSGASPAASVASFTHDYPGAQVVPAGSLGGEAVCAEAQLNGQSMAVCAWFDNDSFGVLMSPTMSTAKLATTLDDVRPSLELYAK